MIIRPNGSQVGAARSHPNRCRSSAVLVVIWLTALVATGCSNDYPTARVGRSLPSATKRPKESRQIPDNSRPVSIDNSTRQPERPETIRAIHAIEELGGTVECDNLVPGQPVVTVFLDASAVTDQDLEFLIALPHVRRLSLLDTNIADAGLLYVGYLRRLKWLYLGRTQTSDAGLSHLRNLDGLEELALYRTAISDAGLTHLSHLHHLRILDLEDTRISDQGLSHLETLTKLQRLGLRSTKISDRGMRSIAKLKGLWGLNVAETSVSDVSLSALSRLPNLRLLDIRRTSINGEGIRHFQEQRPDVDLIQD